ncbi:hypothetical protein BVRB_024830 [Beta vulgaris subsp. vulgaris]|uniref:Uncharacterized protein n=1 Tax=Beta vulgaris subsp. vulgaris TaxID=3555 RepID=A0A0J8B2M3_BETVV|nr:hypothetical protein BVRB_024830 [Beta vulgaris subsp. vulgaris]
MDTIDFDAVIQNPLKFIDDIFQRVKSPLQSTDTDWGEEKLLEEVAEAVKSKLEPCGDGLIRLCGMITESKGSEFYSGVYRDPVSNQVHSGKYRDSAP